MISQLTIISAATSLRARSIASASAYLIDVVPRGCRSALVYTAAWRDEPLGAGVVACCSRGIWDHRRWLASPRVRVPLSTASEAWVMSPPWNCTMTPDTRQAATVHMADGRPKKSACNTREQCSEAILDRHKSVTQWPGAPVDAPRPPMGSPAASSPPWLCRYEQQRAGRNRRDYSSSRGIPDALHPMQRP